MGCKSYTINKRGGGNNTNKREQGAKDVESRPDRISNKINEGGGFWKRIISEEEEICARRAKNVKKQ